MSLHRAWQRSRALCITFSRYRTVDFRDQGTKTDKTIPNTMDIREHRTYMYEALANRS